MPDEAFLTFWRSHYGDCPPVGYLLRETFPERWFRIHSLPDAKRYAETARELVTVLTRHNTIATDLLGADGPAVLVASPSHTPVIVRPARGQRQFSRLGLEPLMIIIETDPKSKQPGWSIPLSSVHIHWQPGALDDVLADVANDLLKPFAIVSETTARVYAPYDGGADLVLVSEAERDAYRTKYEAWLSPHPSGL
jgi:hypothetical protein